MLYNNIILNDFEYMYIYSLTYRKIKYLLKKRKIVASKNIAVCNLQF